MAVNEVTAHELELYTENTGELYPQRKRIIEQLKRKVAEGKYSAPAAAVGAMVRSGRQALRARVRQPGGLGADFPQGAAAARRAAYEYGRIKHGEWN